MSLANPKNPLSVNPGVNSVLVDPTPVLQSRTLINQVRGVTQSGSTGSGIPKAVTNVQASISNAAKGTTSVVNVQFRRDPSDKAYSRVLIFAQGYQGNNTPVQLGSSTDSPATLVVNNTGEAITVIVQASGNGGAVPLAQCPSVGVQLPKSAAGGVGTNTKTSTPATSGSAAAGQLAKFANPATTVTGADLSGDAVTAGGTAVTVEGLQGTPISSSAPRPGDVLAYSIYGDSKWEPINPGLIPDQRVGIYCDPANVATALSTVGTGTLLGESGTQSSVAASYPDLAMVRVTTPGTASTTTVGWDHISSGSINRIPFGCIRRFSARVRLNQTTNCRYWFGIKYSSAGAPGATTFATDTPNGPFFVGFRFSASTDTDIQAVCMNGSSAATTVTSTGVAVDTSHPHLFEAVPASGTVYFYIDGALVATISTNIPANTQGMGLMVCADNKNTANAITIDIRYAHLNIIS